MLRTGQAALIKIQVFCEDLKGSHLQFIEAMSLYYGEAGMRRRLLWFRQSTSCWRTTFSNICEMIDKCDTGLQFYNLHMS